MEAGTFRQDLYFRVAALEIRLPALSSRRVDIIPTMCELLGVGSHQAFTPEFVEALLIWRWRGNFRELKNIVNRLKGNAQPMDFELLPSDMIEFLLARQNAAAKSNGALPTGPDELRMVLERNDWNVTATARDMGKHRMQIQRWMKRFGLRTHREGHGE